MLSALRVLNLKLFHPVFPPEKPNFCVITICQNLTHTHTVSPYLISLFRAQKVFGHMLWQHVGDERFVPTPHLKHLLLLIVHTNLPQEQFPGLELQLHTAGQIEGIKSHICYLASKFYLTNVSNAFFFPVTGSFPLCVMIFKAVADKLWVSEVWYSVGAQEKVTHMASKDVEGDHHDNYHHGHEVLGGHYRCSANTKIDTE